MNAPPDTVERPLQALLALLETEQRTACDRLMAQARADAAALRDSSRAEARARVREAFAAQRRRRDERLVAAQARLATQRRLHAQQQTAALLALALQQLPQELRALWAAPATRLAWMQSTLAGARAQLPAGGWLLRHAPGLTPEERAALAEDGLRFEEDAALEAGLRVEAGANVVDGSLAGLMAGRAEFEARLLRSLESPS